MIADRKNFTLIELLVVIAILSILMGLLFPVLGRIRDKGRKSSCLNNLRQLGIAVNVYTTNNSDHLPLAVRVGLGPGDPFSISNQLDVQTKNVFHCPGDKDKQYEGMTFFARYGSSYEWNTFLSGLKIDMSEVDIQGIRLQMPMLGDAGDFHGDLGRNYLYTDGSVEGSFEPRIQ